MYFFRKKIRPCVRTCRSSIYCFVVCVYSPFSAITASQSYYYYYWGWDSSVVIATRCGLDGQGIESRWWREFTHPSRPALGPTQPPKQWIPAFFPGGEGVGRWDSQPTPWDAEVKERVQLYLLSLSGPSWPVLRGNLPLLLLLLLLLLHRHCSWISTVVWFK